MPGNYVVIHWCDIKWSCFDIFLINKVIIVYLFYFYIEVVFLVFNYIFMMFLSQFFYKFSELEFLYLRIKCYQDARHLYSSCDLYIVINFVCYSHWTIVEFYITVWDLSSPNYILVSCFYMFFIFYLASGCSLFCLLCCT